MSYILIHVPYSFIQKINKSKMKNINLSISTHFAKKVQSIHVFYLFFTLFFSGTTIFAQETNRVKSPVDFYAALASSRNITIDNGTISLDKKDLKGVFNTQSMVLPFTNPDPFTAFSMVIKTQNESITDLRTQLSSSEDGEIWVNWTDLVPDNHADSENDGHVLSLQFLDKKVKYIKLSLTIKKGSTIAIKAAEMHFFNPQNHQDVVQNLDENDDNPNFTTCPCPAVSFVKRSNWCSTCPASSSPTITTVTHLIVHHAAGTNTSTNWGAVVASIWDYHVNTNGWADIGYNWLISPEGKLYEGRGENVQGAHFCGTNGNTMGVCMLGNLDTAVPTTAALDKLKSLLAYKSCKDNINPTDTLFHANSGLNLATISGHQDGCATDCPGANMYPLLPALRLQVDSIINACGAPVSIDSDVKELGFVANIAPNPSEDFFVLKGNTTKKRTLLTTIVDMNGRELLVKNVGEIVGDFSFKYKMSNLPSGMYLLILKDENGIFKSIPINH
jgi:hypothetical protein